MTAARTVHVVVDLPGLPDALPVSAHTRRGDADALVAAHRGTAVVEVPLDPAEPPALLTRLAAVRSILAPHTHPPEIDESRRAERRVLPDPIFTRRVTILAVAGRELILTLDDGTRWAWPVDEHPRWAAITTDVLDDAAIFGEASVPTLCHWAAPDDAVPVALVLRSPHTRHLGETAADPVPPPQERGK